MKNYFLLALAFVCSLLIVSCDKSAETESFTANDSTLFTLASNQTEAEDALNTTDELADEFLESRDNGTCPTISSTAPKGSFPTVVTIDFGTGCVSKHGRYHAGKMIIEQSDSMHKAGAVRKTTFVEFYIDSMKVRNGQVIATNEGKNSLGHRVFSRKTNNMTITGPKGTMDLKSTHSRTLLKGADTEGRADNVWKIEGETIGTVNGEVKFSAIIKEALIVRGDCPYIVAGREEVNHNGKIVKIDFGDGTCDRIARGIKENGDQFVIVLRPRFHE